MQPHELLFDPLTTVTFSYQTPPTKSYEGRRVTGRMMPYYGKTNRV